MNRCEIHVIPDGDSTGEQAIECGALTYESCMDCGVFLCPVHRQKCQHCGYVLCWWCLGDHVEMGRKVS